MGTGASGQLPITPELRAEALGRGVDVVALPTRQACVVLGSADPHEVARSSTRPANAAERLDAGEP